MLPNLRLARPHPHDLLSSLPHYGAHYERFTRRRCCTNEVSLWARCCGRKTCKLANVHGKLATSNSEPNVRFGSAESSRTFPLIE